MAIAETIHLKEAVKKALHIVQNVRGNNSNKLNGVYLITGYKDIIPADYDQAGDIIRFFQFPNGTRLLSGSVISDAQWDTGGQDLELELLFDQDEDSTSSLYTSPLGGGFANQPSGDSVTVVSDNAADTGGLRVVLFGTEETTGAFINESLILNGTTPVTGALTNWDKVLGLIVTVGIAAGDITVQKTTGSLTITTVPVGTTSLGLDLSVALTIDDEILTLIPSKPSSATIALGGTYVPSVSSEEVVDMDGSGSTLTTQEWSLVSIIYIGDVAADTTISIGTDLLMVQSASDAFAVSPPRPINFHGGEVIGTEVGADVSSSYLSLRVAVPPTVGNPDTVRITYKIFVYHGATSEVI